MYILSLIERFFMCFQTKVALMYDAVRLFATALKDLHPDTGPKITVQPLSCEREHKWSQGNAFVKYMRMVSTLRFISILCRNNY